MANNDITLTIKANSSQLVNALSNAGVAVKDFANKAEKSSDKGTNGFKKFSGAVTVAAGNLISQGIHKGINMISSSIDSAVKRVDTLNNFPKVMSNVGISADQARAAIQKASDGIKGMPTSLDTAAQSIQRLTMKTKDVDKATDIFLALNNAVLAGGASSEVQAAAMEQLSQAFARGKPDMLEWRSAMTAMPAQMDQLAKAMGQVDANALYEQIRDGKITMDDLSEALIRLNTSGSGGLPTFAEQAKNATGGLQTGMENAKTAVVRGVAKIIEAFGSGDMSAGAGKFGLALEQVLNKVADLIKFVKENKEAFTVAGAGLAVFTGAVIAYDTATKVASATAKAWTVATKAVTAAQWLLNAAMSANPIGIVVVAIAALVAGFVWLWNNVEDFRNFFIGVWDGIKSAVDSAGQFIGQIIDGVVETFSGVADAVSSGIGSAVDTVVSVVSSIVDAISSFASPIIQIFTDVFGTAYQIVSSVVILIVAIVATIAEGVFNVLTAVGEFFGSVFGTVVEIVGGAIGSVIEFFAKLGAAIIEHVSTFVGNIVSAVTTTYDNIVATITPIVEWFNTNIIQPVAAFFLGLWNGVVDGARKLWNGVTTTLGAIGGWISANVINPVKNFFAGLWNGITSGVRAAADTIRNVMGTIAGFVKAPINGIIDIVNGVIDSLNRIKVPDWVPGLGGKSPNFPKIPKLASGGIVGPQNGGSIIYAGDGGQNEWVVPESKMASLVGQINRRLDGSGGEITKHITVNNTYNVRDRVDAQMVASDLGYLLTQA